MKKKNNSLKYPKIDDSDFYKKIENKFSMFKEPKSKRTYKEICFPKKFELRNSQKFPAAYISPNTPYKDLLLFHQIGSGKTCAMIRIGEEWKKERKIIFVCPAGLINNFLGELRSECADNEYLSVKEREKLKSLDQSSDEYNEIINKSNERISKNYEIYSQHKFINLLKNKEINFEKKILLIDEIQNMISINGSFYKILYNSLLSAPGDLRIVLASATPMFDKPYEIGLTLNLLRIKNKFPDPRNFMSEFVKSTVINEKTKEISYDIQKTKKFKEMIKGYISYFSGGDPLSLPKKNIFEVKCKMSDYQYKSYITTMRNSKFYEKLKKSGTNVTQLFNKGEILDLPSNFFIGPRLISNISYPNKKTGEEGFKLFDGEPETLNECSSKIEMLMKNIIDSKGKSYIYSNFRNYGGLLPIEVCLKKNGYKNYDKNGPGKKRYAFWSGEESKTYRNQVVQEYNKLDNNDGKNLEIILLSPAGKEGLSLFGVRNAHIFEPYWNVSRIDQIIGRGVRFCSHKNVPEKERFVNVYMYLATSKKSNEISIDEYIHNMAKKKDRLIKQFEKELINASIDKNIL